LGSSHNAQQAGSTPASTLLLARAIAIKDGRVDLRRGSAESLPFADDTFDKALAINSMQVWPDAAAGLRAIQRVMRPRQYRARRKSLRPDAAKLTSFMMILHLMAVLASPACGIPQGDKSAYWMCRPIARSGQSYRRKKN
jgi:ubiquinone/menaquinone biosynthesis C-methylase UbiE